MPGLILLWLLAAGGPPDALLVADFEGPDFGAWTVTGEAFGPGPAAGALPRQMTVSGYLGRGLANSYHGGDGAVGTLTSPEFEIVRPYLSFLIGGGKWPGQTCLDLLVGGQVVRTATGPNERPGGSERLRWTSWDVAELIGRRAVLRLVDTARGGWGHVTVDHICQTKEPLVPDETRALTLDRRYLNLPVRAGAPKQRVSLTVGGEIVREFEIELVTGEPEFRVFLDLAPFAGREAVLTLHDRPLDGSVNLAGVTLDDEPAGGDFYRERLRPQFHFSSRRGWLNDPNGLVFFDGEYHLFYQHNPYGWSWGNMHWGHAVSRDLIHWTELPIAIYPRQFGDWAFSGSAVIDWRNTSGCGDGVNPPLVIAYTSTGRGEVIAYSRDRGRSFTEVEGNPVVRHRGRDPRLLWHEPTSRWIMAVYDEQVVEDQAKPSQHIAFYTSPDLHDWEFASRLEGFYECPELFALPLDGDPNRLRWIAYGADGEYVIGQFDGQRFTVTDGRHRYHWGNAFYASQTWSDLPPADGRRIQIAWGRAATPGMPFNQCLLCPVELRLETTPDGPRLLPRPIREIETLRTRTHRWGDFSVGERICDEVTGELFDLELVLEPGTAETVTLTVRGVDLTWRATGELTCAGQTGPLAPVEGVVRLRALIDRTTIEIFGHDGRLYLPVAVTAPGAPSGLSLRATGGPALVRELVVHELRSSWPGGER